MNVTVMKQIKFCAGHRLLGHEGKCANLHGHNYTAQIFVSGKEVDSLGRVIDFAVINKLFKGWIDENWDHGFLLWNEDKAAIAAINSLDENRMYLLPYNPTAENIARYLVTEVAPGLVRQIKDYDVSVPKVILWETENSFAEVTVGNSVTNENQTNVMKTATPN